MQSDHRVHRYCAACYTVEKMFVGVAVSQAGLGLSNCRENCGRLGVVASSVADIEDQEFN